MHKLFFKTTLQIFRYSSIASAFVFLANKSLTKNRIAKMETLPSMPTAQISLKDIINTDQDILIIIDPSSLIESYQLQTNTIINDLKASNPSLVVITVTAKELLENIPNLESQLKSDSFIIARNKSNPKFEVFDYAVFFMKTHLIDKFFTEIPKVESLDANKLNKFATFLSVCEGTPSSLSALKKLVASDEFSGFSPVNFNSCKSFEATPDDLFILKKNSQANSYDDNFVKIINDQKFDFIKMDKFFKNNDFNSNEKKLAESINSFSVFTPLSLLPNLENTYTLMLAVDLNKTPDSQRKKLQLKFKKIAEIFNKNNKNDICFIYRPLNLKKESYQITLLDNHSQNVRLLYKSHNAKKSVQQKLEDKYPFLTNKKSDTFIYRFDTNLQKFNLENFKTFFDKVKSGEFKCHYESEESKPFRASRKLVYDNFPSIFQDQKDHLVFFFSSHCQMCKKVAFPFEELCLENFVSKSFPGLEFNRVNVSQNTFYNHSPVIAYFKKGFTHPFILHGQFFTSETLRNFVSSLNDVSFDATYPVDRIQE